MRRTLATAVLVLAGLVPAGPGRAWSGPAPVRVVLPAAGEELVAGSLATLAWEREDLDSPSRIAEWEAFLSLDGGRSWPLRLTPHLDIGIRRFTFRVPAFPCREALPPPESAELASAAALRERVPAETAVPRPAAETRLLIHRYNE